MLAYDGAFAAREGNGAMPARRVVTIGLDAFDRNLLARWGAAGLLPHLRALMDQGAQAAVANPRGFEPGSSWPSFAYCLPPAVHGQFDGMMRFDTALYAPRTMEAHERAAVPFWMDAGAAGRRVAIVDVPYALLETAINGVQVTDWLCHVYRTRAIATLPAGLGRRIVRDHGDAPFDRTLVCPTDFARLPDAASVLRFRDALLDRVARKAAFLEALLREHPWDLFLAVFHDAHDIGHMTWHLHDPAHPRHDATLAAAAGDPVLDVYRALDAAIGRLRAAAGDALFVVYGNVGMGEERTGSHFLDDILRRLAAAYDGAPAAAAPAPPPAAGGIGALYRSMVPATLREAVARTPAMRRRYRRASQEAAAAARRARPFFELAANHATGGVRLNLKGREAAGRIEPGEAAALCARLARDLTAIVNVDSGQPMIRAAVPTSALHDGPARVLLPDLLLEWDRAAPIRRVGSPLLGELTNTRTRSRTGDHAEKLGFVLAAGVGVEPARPGEPVGVCDLAPALLAALGVPVGRFPGRPAPVLGT